jgi:hypothetical protein
MAMSEGRRETGYLVELVAAGELPDAERRRVLDHAAEATGGDRMAPLLALSRDAEATLARLPPERVAAEVGRRAARELPRRRRWGAWLALPVLAGVTAAAVVLPRQLPVNTTTAVDGVRVKGLAPRLVVHRRISTGVERVAPGTPVRSGDLIQLGYVSAPGRFGVIVSLDGGGGVTRHWPIGGRAAAPLEPGREVLLPESFWLDAAPRFERFIFVTSDRPFEVAPILDAARALAHRPDARDAPISLPPGLAGADVLLLKETR